MSTGLDQFADKIAAMPQGEEKKLATLGLMNLLMFEAISDALAKPKKETEKKE